MPQFDIFSYFNQVTWVILFFTIVYNFLDHSILILVATTLKLRSIKQAVSVSVISSSNDTKSLSDSGVKISSSRNNVQSLLSNFCNTLK